MTHRLSASTRAVAAATAATAVFAVADLLDTAAGSIWAMPAILLLGVGVIVMMRVAEAAVEIREDVVVVRNVTSTRTFARSEVVGFEAGTWNSRLFLADGSVVLSLLREKDLLSTLDLSQHELTVVTPITASVPVAV